MSDYLKSVGIGKLFFSQSFIISLIALSLAGGACYLTFPAYAKSPQKNRIALISEEFKEGVISNDKIKLEEALDNISKVIHKDPGNIDALDLRFNIYLSLGMKESAYKDLKEINTIKPTGERILGECLYYREVHDTENLYGCYSRALAAFERVLTEPEGDINYLVSSILMDGNEESVSKLSNLFNDTEDPLIVDTYKTWAKELFEAEVYFQLFPDNSGKSN